MTLPLTPQQEKLWRFIMSCERSPTHDEMAKELGYPCRGTLTANIVNTLERKGYLRRFPGHRGVVAIDPMHPPMEEITTSALLAELERRGILLGLPS